MCPCLDSGDCLVLVLSLHYWLSTVVSGWSAMASKRREGLRGSWVKNVQKQSWRVRSQLMGERNGRVNSAQNRMFGRDGVAGAATMTSRQGCVGSAGKRLPQGEENGLRALRRRAERKKGETKAWRQRTRSFDPGLRAWKRTKVKQSKEGKGFHQGERAVWKKSKNIREKRNSQGKDPRTFDENSQGGNLRTLKTNS